MEHIETLRETIDDPQRRLDTTAEQLAEWHYLPEVPAKGGIYLAVFEGATRVQEAYFEPHFGKFRYENSDNPFDYRDAIAWCELPPMPPRP